MLSLILLLTACKEQQDSGGSDSTNLAIALQIKQLADTSSFALPGGERCVIVAEATIQYPVATAGGEAVDSLQRLFAAFVLESGDTLSLTQAMQQVVANSMHQYDFAPAGSMADVNDEAIHDEESVTLNYATSTRVTPIYNKNGVVTFERVDVVKKNGKVTSVAHRYYSFDVETQTYIDVNRLIRDDAVADVCKLLKQKLLTQNNATGNEQLNDLGYFNVENISVTRNFFFDEGGVTWSFLPNELAVEAVGEPKITLTHDELEPCLCVGSIISRLK